MKKFDYELAVEMGVSKERLAFYKSVQDKKISLAYFMISIKRLPKKIGSRSHTPRMIKREYNNLKDNFGFFQ